jgi:carboxypeptidase A4
MKFAGVALASLGLVSAASVTKGVSYDDWKVYRINVGSNAAKIEDAVTKFHLGLWKGKPSTSEVVDVMVPPAQIKDFEAFTQGVETKVMHENLGLSIADEQAFGAYAEVGTAAGMAA